MGANIVILNHEEMEANLYEIGDCEYMTWTVQCEENCFASDWFCGSEEEATEYAKELVEQGATNVRVALITVDKTGSDIYTNEVISIG